MDSPLDPVELRVLGALIEKESTTPEYYPMTLNSLVAACNQKTNRFPVTEYTEGDVTGGIDGLKARGFALFVITNQPEVSRGKQTRGAVENIHRTLSSSLPIDDIFVCYHDDNDDCDCRKPLPGLLLEARGKHNIDFSRSFVVGDRWRDIDAGHNAGCKAVLIDYGYRERAPTRPPEATVRSLREAADWIISSALKESTDEDKVRV